MKKMVCRQCNSIWYVNSGDLCAVRTCPFCSQGIRIIPPVTVADTLDKAIYLAVSNLGSAALTTPTRMVGYISDTTPNLKKELRVLSHSFREEYFSIVRKAFNSDIPKAESLLAMLVDLLINEDGLSEMWANQIGSGYLGAIKRLHGVGSDEVLLADVFDCVFFESERQPSCKTNNHFDRTETDSSDKSTIIDYSGAKVNTQESNDLGKLDANTLFIRATQYWQTTYDKPGAYKLYQMAAEKGHVDAQYELGYKLWFYEDDKPSAIVWLKKAAAQGHRQAKAHLNLYRIN